MQIFLNIAFWSCYGYFNRLDLDNTKQKGTKQMKIDKNIPVPPSAAGRPNKYQWRDMEIGDSVFFDNEPKGAQSKPSTGAYVWGHKNNTKFAARKEGSGVRIWRTA